MFLYSAFMLLYGIKKLSFSPEGKGKMIGIFHLLLVYICRVCRLLQVPCGVYQSTVFF